MKTRFLLTLIMLLTLGLSIVQTGEVEALAENSDLDDTGMNGTLQAETDEEKEKKENTSDDQAALILLGDEITISGQGAKTDGSNVYITAGGTYSISGELKDGQIDVNTSEKVKIILDGAYISNSSGPALMVNNAQKTTLVLEEGTTNYLGDAENKSEYNAALFTNDTLVIQGEGILVVNGNNTEGISSDDDIIIESGTLRIIAMDDGLNAHDDISIEGGYVYILAGGDGIDSNGTIHISGGLVISLGSIAMGDGGVDSIDIFEITGGTLISTGNTNAAPDSASTQYSLYFNKGSDLPEGTLIHIEDAQGGEVLTFAPKIAFTSLFFSSDDLDADMEYNVYLGGSASGTESDGLYSGADYDAADSSTLTATSAIVPEGVGEMGP